jgi:hypothetical protein
VFRLLGSLLVVLGVLLLTPVATALSDLATQSATVSDGFADDSDPQVIPEEPNPAASDGPELSQAQGDRAVSLALADSRVQARLAGKSYQVHEIGPWSTGGATDTLVGAIVIIRLASLASYPMSDWPVPVYESHDDTSYSDGTIRISATGVSDLVVSVDLARDVVVGIEPDGDDVSISDESDAYPICHPWDPSKCTS